MKSHEDAVAEIVMAIVKKHAEVPMPCILCDTPTRCRGIFIPGDASAWGGRKTAERFIVYPFCKNHNFDVETLVAEVEPKIKAWLSRIEEQHPI